MNIKIFHFGVRGESEKWLDERIDGKVKSNKSVRTEVTIQLHWEWNDNKGKGHLVTGKEGPEVGVEI
jgi:hypothetical protein